MLSKNVGPILPMPSERYGSIAFYSAEHTFCLYMKIKEKQKAYSELGRNDDYTWDKVESRGRKRFKV